MRVSTKSTAVLLLFLFVITVIPSILMAGAGVPKFYVAKTTVDMGELLEGSDVIYNFVVQNKGTAELQILSVRPG